VFTPKSFALSSFSIYQWYFLGVPKFRPIHLDRPILDCLHLRVCRSDSSRHAVDLNHHVDCLELRENVPHSDCFHDRRGMALLQFVEGLLTCAYVYKKGSLTPSLVQGTARKARSHKGTRHMCARLCTPAVRW